ncbi:unnamed protein product, partial [Ectocarpus sp. 13 AM-2016]
RTSPPPRRGAALPPRRTNFCSCSCGPRCSPRRRLRTVTASSGRRKLRCAAKKTRLFPSSLRTPGRHWSRSSSS